MASFISRRRRNFATVLFLKIERDILIWRLVRKRRQEIARPSFNLLLPEMLGQINILLLSCVGGRKSKHRNDKYV